MNKNKVKSYNFLIHCQVPLYIKWKYRALSSRIANDCNLISFRRYEYIFLKKSNKSEST